MTDELKIFVGVDKRQILAYTVARSSIERHASARVAVEPLFYEWMPVKRRGLTDFTYTRYAVPHLCGFKGRALFVDGDIVVRGDVHELASLTDPLAQVSVSKNKLRFEWPSVMFFNCGACLKLTPEYIETNSCNDFAWAKNVGDLPPEWNHLVGYDEPNPNAKLIHYTRGIPCWKITQDCEHSATWLDEFKHAVGTVSWEELMGNSVHAESLLRELRAKAA